MVKLNNSNIQQSLEHKDNFTQKLVRNIKHISAHHLRSLPQPHFGMIFLKSNIKETIYGRTETSIIIVQPYYIRNEPCMPYYLAVVIAFRGLYFRVFFIFYFLPCKSPPCSRPNALFLLLQNSMILSPVAPQLRSLTQVA